jgi:hypothetical protein
MSTFRRSLPPAIAFAGLIIVSLGHSWGMALLLFGLAFTLVDMIVPPSFPPGAGHKGKDGK